MNSSPIILVVGGIAVMLACGLLLMWLVRASRSLAGQELIASLLVALLVIDGCLYENQDHVPNGLFHPHLGSLSFRIFDVLVPLALLARVIARPAPRPIPLQGLFWAAFLVWILFAAIEGAMGGNPKDFLTYEAKVIIYLGTFVLVSAVPAKRWLESRPMRRVVLMSSALAAYLLVANESHVQLNLNLPLIPLSGFGVMGTDAATIFATLGLITLAVGACSDRYRLRTLLVALPLLAAPVVAGQRAALVGLAAALAVLAVAGFFGRAWIRVKAVEVGIMLAVVLAVFTAVIVINAMGSSKAPFPFVQQIQATFGSRGKQLSASDRINQWTQARALIASRPWFGWGLGKTYEYYSPGFFQFMTTDLTHNIALDLLVRTGIVGLALFLLAVASSVWDCILAAVSAVDGRVAAFAMACGAVIIGLFAKGMFESIFEKYRLAVLLGVLAGVSVSFATERLKASESVRDGLRTDVVRRVVPQ